MTEKKEVKSVPIRTKVRVFLDSKDFLDFKGVAEDQTNLITDYVCVDCGYETREFDDINAHQLRHRNRFLARLKRKISRR